MNGTVGHLIEKNIRITRYCETCGEKADVDLHRIAVAKGFDFDLTDRLPLCTNGDCIGMIRFQAHAGMRRWFLLTTEGEERVLRHADWVSNTQIYTARREYERKLRREREGAG